MESQKNFDFLLKNLAKKNKDSIYDTRNKP